MERIDDTGFGDIRVIQKEGFGYGVDSVLLAAFASGETGASGIVSNARAADLGTDSGIAAFILAHKNPSIHATGIEVREDAAMRAVRSAQLSSLDDRVTVITDDVLDICERRPELRCSFDAVISNPPYFRRGAAIPSSSPDRFIARHETTADIRDFSRTAAGMLKDGGDFYLVHRPDRLADIIEALRGAGLEPKTMQLVTPSPGKSPNILLLHSVKGGGAELRILPEIAVHTDDGGYSDIILRMYERV